MFRYQKLFMLKKVNYPKYVSELYDLIKNKNFISIVKEIPNEMLFDIMQVFPNVTRKKLENSSINEQIIMKTF